MSKIKTDLDKIRELAVSFLYVDIAETRLPFVASHPFTNSWIACAPKTELLDLRNEEHAKKWRGLLKEQMQKSDVLGMFILLNRPYILNFLKFASKYMSDADLGKVLGCLWTTIEQISLDDSVTGQNIVSWFSRADRAELMDEEDRAFYESLPEEVTIYRGVTSYNNRRKKALSWTVDRSVAEWFANRFQTGTGEVWTLTVPKNRILCAFSGKEREVVVNLYGFKEQMKVEKL